MSKKSQMPFTEEGADALKAAEAERVELGEQILDAAQAWVLAFLAGRARIQFSVDPVGYSVHLSAIEPAPEDEPELPL